MLLYSHISVFPRCLAEKGCSLVRCTLGTSQGEDKLGARDKILIYKGSAPGMRLANIPPVFKKREFQQHLVGPLGK